MLTKIISAFILLQLFIFHSTNQIQGAYILGSENFDDLTDNGWIRQHEFGNVNYSSMWSFRYGMYGLKIDSSFIIENSFWGDNSWTDYQVDFDMLPISGDDKNFMLRYQDRSDENLFNRWYEIHVSGTTIHLSKHGYGDIVPAKNIPITNGATYNWRATLKGTKIRIEYKTQNESLYTTIFNVEDNTPNPILNGKIGIRIGAGSNYPVEIYFDNIVVTDLSSTTLDVKHLSQTDPRWGSEVYDNAPKWANPGSTGIKNWGCALTSASMVLNYYGFPNNPSDLNHYLINNRGYNAWGGVIWSYFTKYASETKANHPELAGNKLLEFDYPVYNPETIKQDISNLQPDIINLLVNQNKQSHHFVVSLGYNKQTQDIFLLDPALIDPEPVSLHDNFSNTIKQRLARFVPSNTDLSYLWVYASDNLGEFSITDKTGQPIPGSETFLDGGIADNQSDDRSPLYTTYMLAKPTTGEYNIALKGSQPGFYTVEVVAFDRQANDVHYLYHLYSDPGSPQKLTLNLNLEDLPATALNRSSSGEIIQKIITYGYNQGKIKHQFIKHLLHMIDQIVKQTDKANWQAATSIKNATINQILTAAENQISSEYRDYLITELRLLDTSNRQ